MVPGSAERHAAATAAVILVCRESTASSAAAAAPLSIKSMIQGFLRFTMFSLATICCLSLPGLAGEATLTQAQVIKLATAVAKKKGQDLRNYEPPKVRFEKKDDMWWIYYQARLLKPGSYFSVTVQDKTKQTEYFE